MHNINERYLSACPVGCEAALIDTNIGLTEGKLQRCMACGQLLSQCTESRYHLSMQEFNEHNSTLPQNKDKARAFRLHTKRLNLITKHLKKNPTEIKLLDVGCSSGDFLLTAKKLGFTAEGVEPAPKAAITAQNLGLNVTCGLLENLNLPEKNYDAITLFEVIEHLAKPMPLLLECQKLLKKSGLLIINTGNSTSWTAKIMRGKWEYFHIEKHGGHITFYNPASIKKLSAALGMETTAIKTRCVSFVKKTDTPYLLYRSMKLFTEILNMPSQMLRKGHDMLVILRKVD